MKNVRNNLIIGCVIILTVACGLFVSIVNEPSIINSIKSIKRINNG